LLDDSHSPSGDEPATSWKAASATGGGSATRDSARDILEIRVTGREGSKIRMPRPRRALSDVGRYLLVASAFLAAALMLALADEESNAPHLAVASALLMVGMMMASLIAVYKAKVSMEGASRPVSPSMLDNVTDLPNDEYFRLRLRDESRRMQRYGTSLSVAVLDVNNLASVDDAYGELAGDAVLKHIAGLIDATKRASDVAARLSHDEFGLILLECGEEDAVRFLGRLERYIGRKPVSVNVDGQSVTLWVGMCSGVASAQRGDANGFDLLAQARRSLEAAKDDRDRRRERWTRTA
jgi:diguanylate cyclase (GGDEF)-like protein